MITVKQYKEALAIVNEFHSQLDLKNMVTPENIKVGLHVIDTHGDVGVITSCEDLHNVQVEYDNEGKGLFCLVSECKEDDEQFLIIIDDDRQKETR